MNQIRAAGVLFGIMFVVTGIIYPLITLNVAQMLFPHQAKGSLIIANDKIIGSELIGQNFSGASYFHSRPSAAGPDGYDASNSSASNLAPTNSDFIKAVSDRATTIRAIDKLVPIPVDIVTSSASGLDPHISIDAAKIQIATVALARHLDAQAVTAVVNENTEGRFLGLFGEQRVNVLKINFALDHLTAHSVAP
jgi:K+-transporting ATPase ATPase C chain